MVWLGLGMMAFGVGLMLLGWVRWTDWRGIGTVMEEMREDWQIIPIKPDTARLTGTVGWIAFGIFVYVGGSAIVGYCLVG